MRLTHLLTLVTLLITSPTRAADPAQAPAPAPPLASRPNIVIILVDDLGYSDLGCYGSEIPTPNLDRLAQSGLRFTHFYNAGRCCPSRAALLTGLHPHQAGVGCMIDGYAKSVRDQLDSPAYADHLSPSCPTIAELLRAGGYRTLMCGKWHLGYRRLQWPARRGFDRSLVQIDGAMNYFGPGVQHTPGDVPPMALNDQPFTPPRENFYATDAYTEQAVEWLTEAAAEKKPFFLYLAYSAPHWPLHAPAQDIARHLGKYRDGWEAVRKARHRRQLQLGVADAKWGMAPPDRGPHKPWHELTDAQRDEWDLRMAVYAAQVERMDAGIGRVLEALRQTGVEQNTLVLFLSDNGGAAEDPKKGKPGAVTGTRDSYAGYGRPWATVSNTPLRLHKQRMHEGGISTPAILYWPGRVAAPGSITPQPAHLIDVLPTCLAAAGVERAQQQDIDAKPAPPEGINLLPVLSGGTLPDRTLCWEHEGHRAARHGNWKLVALHGGDWELYDLAADRTESHNLAATHPQKVAELKKLYESWSTRCGVLPYPAPPPKPTSTPAAR